MGIFDQGLAAVLGQPTQDTPGSPGLAAALDPTAVQPQPDAPAASPLGGISDALAAHPAIGQALLHTFISLARGNDIGNAVANGAVSSLYAQAQGKADEKEAQARQDKLSQQDTQNAQEGQRLSIYQQNADTAGKTAEANAQRSGAAVNESNARVDQMRQLLQPRIAQINAQVDSLRQQAAASRDAMKTSAINRQILQLTAQSKALQNELDQTYAGQEREVGIEAKRTATAGQAATNEFTIQKNNAFRNAPEADKEAAVTGQSKKPGQREQFLDFVNKNAANYIDKNGRINTAGLMQDWSALSNGEPAPVAMSPETRQAWITARNSAKPGGKYVGPDGKTYVRPAEGPSTGKK